MTMTKHNFFFTACVVSIVLASSLALATGTSSNTATPVQKQSASAAVSYTEINLDQTDPKAVDIIKKLLADDMKMMAKLGGRAPRINAQFIQLGPQKPKDSIIAYIDHTAFCGSSGCRVVIVTPTGPNKYRIVLDTTLGRIFTNLRTGQDHYDFLGYVMPRSVNGFGVYFWNDKKGIYEFAGVSKFKK